MKMTIVAVFCGIAALVAAGIAWQKHQGLEQARIELANANAQVQKSKQEQAALSAEAEALRKESAAQKLATERAQADLANAHAFLEAEKAAGARLRAELASVAAMLAAASKPRQVQAPTATDMLPRAIQVRPMRIQAAPSGAAIGAGAPAR